MGLSCSNPTATAHLRAGEVVVDLGSGGGLDVFLAAKVVGPEGRAPLGAVKVSCNFGLAHRRLHTLAGSLRQTVCNIYAIIREANSKSID